MCWNASIIVNPLLHRVPLLLYIVVHECRAIIPQYKVSGNHLINFANRQLEISYKYMLLAAQFKSYVKDRPGFHGKFKGLSDRSWEQGIGLIKYMTKRGGKMKFGNTNELTDGVSEVSELQAMATVLDTEKRLFERAREIHNFASHAHKNENYDPEVAHFIEEEHLESLANTVRQYAGYANDLKNLYVGSKDINMDNYLYDQYLQKA